MPVSYTHLDVYKRQRWWCAKAWHTNSDRPYTSTGNNPTVSANLWTAVWDVYKRQCVGKPAPPMPTTPTFLTFSMISSFESAVTSSTLSYVVSVNRLMDNEEDPVIWRGPVIDGVVKQFWNETAWGDIDYLFVDMPPGTGDVPLTVFQSLPVDGIVIAVSYTHLDVYKRQHRIWRFVSRFSCFVWYRLSQEYYRHLMLFSICCRLYWLIFLM